MALTVKGLRLLLAEFDPEMEVTVRVSVPTDDSDGPIDVSVEDGDYLNVTDERSVLVEFGKLVIVGDYPEEV